MVNKLFMLSALSIMWFSSFLSADSSHSEFAFIERKVNLLHSEFDKASTERLSEEIISKNIEYLEEVLFQSLNRSERKLARYKNRLKEVKELAIEGNYDFKDPKKVKSLERRIKAIKEILFSIQVLKLRFDM